MAMVTVTSPCNAKTLSIPNHHHGHFRDASFSSYINGAGETFVLKLPDSPITTHQALQLGSYKVEGEEIGVFDAKKYFDGEEESPKITTTNNNNKKIVPQRPKPHSVGTPSVHSETTSWNSQSALLQPPNPGNPIPRKPNKAYHGKSSFFASLGCNCSCNDKNSVDIDDHINDNINNNSVNKSPLSSTPRVMEVRKIDELGLGLGREDCFSFPVLNSKKGNSAEDIHSPRKSLEVFGSPILGKGQRTLTLERKLTVLNWDSASETRIKSNSDGIRDDDIDTESDSSSDLFEIESLTNSNGNPILTRQESDCYAPSEASIEWSVVTASAADYSVMSDSEEPRAARNINRIVASPKTSQKRRPSLLVCKSQKAVNVAGDAYRASDKGTNDARRRHKTESYAPSTRFGAETYPADLDSRIRRHNSSVCSISRAHSATASHLLYIE